MEFKIRKISAKKILDSRGNPAVQVGLVADSGIFFASAPSGASKGKYEVVEVRDKDGRGVKKAIENIEKVIASELKGKNPAKQREIDELLIKLDGTKNKSKLGVNAILPVSIAVCRAGAVANKLPLYLSIFKITEAGTREFLPRPCFNIINGGKHAKKGLAIQEFMVVPNLKTFSQNLDAGKKIYKKLKGILGKEFGKSGIVTGDEGGFVPPLKKTQQALGLIMEAIEKAGFLNKTDIILDAAATSFFKNGKYEVDGNILNQEDLADFYLNLAGKYPIIGIEDPFAEEDWEGWAMLNCKLQIANCKLLIIGDDLTVTNPKRIKLAREKDACSAIIIKPNQIGTVTETLEATKLAKSFDWKIMVSHRSGETMDDFISDLAVGLGSDFIKSGAPGPKERIAKYNRLVAIEEELKSVN